jgi:putative ABC transport system permease protein
VDAVIQDLRVGLRLLAARPGFAAVAMLTLALGIGANTAVFSVVNSVLLRPLPYPESDGLLRVSEERPISEGRRMAALTNEIYHPWLERTRTLEALAAYSPRAYTLTGRGEARRMQGAAVSASLFPMLRAAPALGRTFTQAEEKPGANRVVILSHAAWLWLFAGDAAAVGRAITLDGNPHEIVGVMPAWFYFPDRDAELWTPQYVPLPSRSANERNVFAFAALARLRPGVTLEQARAEGSAIVSSLFADAPRVRTPLDAERAPELRLIPLKDEMVRGVRSALLILTAVVALVLLVAAANLANLLLARGAARQREIAIRAAVGAGRGRLVQQLLTESLLLAALGGAAGLGLAWALVRVLPAIAPQDFPRLDELALDGRVLLFTLVVSMVTGVLFGLAPAFQGLRIDLTRALAESGGMGSGGFRFVRGNRTRLTLVVAEIAIASVLLVGAGLLVKSFVRLIDVDPGYDPSNVLTARLPLPPAKYPTSEASGRFYDLLLERVAALPDVAAAGLVNALPLSPGLMLVAFGLPERPPAAGQGPPTASVRIVSAGYFRAMGLRLVEGRALAETDRTGSRPVVLVNESFARTYFPGERLVGRELPIFRQPSEVVGIVADVRHAGLDAEPRPEVYVTYHQSEQFRAAGAYLVVRSRTDPTSLVPALRAAVRATDPDIPLESVMTMEARLAASVAQPRFFAALLALFGAIAMTLAAVGVYGVLSYSVLQRRREIGVRMAMGAEPGAVRRLLVGQGAVLVAVGLALGLGAAALASRALTTLLFGVTARDPGVFAGVAAVVGAIAIAACYVPARRAALVDPLEALRYE